jgi:hypothetical protein
MRGHDLPFHIETRLGPTLQTSPHPRLSILRRTLTALALGLLLAGCRQLESLPYTPPQTPESWLTIQPHVELIILSRSVILVQPTTTAMVYALGLLGIGVGVHLLRIGGGQRSRLWWGVALILWGVGALLAGTSYEAFSYHIKCAGRAACLWTSGWEIGYLLLSVASVDAIVLAQAYACAAGRARRRLALYAAANLALYALALLVGTLIPIRFLISFEFLLVVTAPSIVLVIVHNAWRYRRLRRRLDRALLVIWAGLALTIAAYFVYLISGLTQRLWSRGHWFSENDVLHLGLIAWMIYIAIALAPHLADEPQPGAS